MSMKTASVTPPDCKLGTESESRLFAVSVSAKVPPPVDALEAVLSTTACGIARRYPYGFRVV